MFVLKKHTRVTLTMMAFSLDTWDNEYFEVYANGINIIKEQFHYSKGKNICGTGYGDRMRKLKISFAHTDDLLILKVTSTLNEAANNESFGFNDVVIKSCV